MLLVHDFRPDAEDLVTIVLDDRAGVHRRKAFDGALSAIIALVSEATRRSADVEVVTLSGRRITGSPTPEGMVELLTFLAGTQPRRVPSDTAPGLARPGGPDGAIVVTTQTARTTLPPPYGTQSVVVVE